MMIKASTLGLFGYNPFRASSRASSGVRKNRESMRSIFVTGGGKCGTHLVSAFIHSNWPNSVLHRREFGTWETDLSQLTCDKLIFHCVNLPVEPYRRLCPNGTLLAMVRNPVQQYISWLCTFAQALLAPPKEDRGEMHARAKRCVLFGFDVARQADYTWRLEDFSSSKERRLSLVNELLGGESLDIDPSISVPKTRFGWGNGVQTIRGDEYPSILTDEEIVWLDRPDIGVTYPGWVERLSMLDKSDTERLHKRGRFIIAAARHVLDRRLEARQRQKQPTLRSSDEALDIYMSGFVSR